MGTSPPIPIYALGFDPETSIISSLTMDRFHSICYWYLSTLSTRVTPGNTQLGAILSLHGESIQEIAHLPGMTFNEMGWRGPWTDYGRRIPTDMENGWSRYIPFVVFTFSSRVTKVLSFHRFHSSCVTGPVDRRIKLITAFCCWLSQANYVFSQIPTGQCHEDYCE